MCEFIDCHLLEKEIEGDFSQKILRLKFDEYYESRLNSLKIKRKEELDVVHSMKQNKSRDKKRMFMKSYKNRVSEAENNLKTKMLIAFDHSVACSIKSLAIQKNTKVNTTTRFMKGKRLMFAKVSLMSFIYDMIETFSFPNKKVENLDSRYRILKCLPYHILTNMDRTTFQFIFICKVNCTSKQIQCF